MTFANNLDPDQARQKVGPDLNPNCLTLWWYSWTIFFEKVDFEKISRQQKSMKIYQYDFPYSSLQVKTEKEALKGLTICFYLSHSYIYGQ